MSRLKNIFLQLAGVLLLFLAVCGRAEAGALSSEKFRELFPKAEWHDAYFVMDLDECRIVAIPVVYSLSSTGEIALILVTSEKKAKAVQVAEQLVNLFKDGVVSPFQGKEPAAAILLPLRTSSTTELYSRSLIRVLFYPSSYKEDLQFIDLDGTKLKVRTEHYAADSTKKKSKATVELTLDLAERQLPYITFRLVRGSMDESDIKAFVGPRIYRSSFYLPGFSTKEKNALKRELNCSDIISYSTSSDFGIVSKGKVYRVGSLSGLRDSARTRDQIVQAIESPSQASQWPASVTTAASNNQIAQNTDSSAKPAPAANTPQPQQQQARPQQPLKLTPSEALMQYLENLKRM